MPRNETICKGCGKPIMFLRDEIGRFIPLDIRAPVYEIKKDFSGIEVASLVAENFHVNHFSTCTSAKEFTESQQKLKQKYR